MALTLDFKMPQLFRVAWVSEPAREVWEPRLNKLRLVLEGKASISTEDMAWLSEVMDWPMKWDSLHGIGLLTLPVCRIVMDAEAVAEQEVIERMGTKYPVEGARSPVFPFRETQPLVFRKKDVWTDNGFSSAKAMQDAHEIIVTAAKNFLISGNRNIEGDKIIDLGCGNGFLLEEICNATPGVIPYGIEQDPQRCARAVLRLQKLGGDAYPANLFDFRYWLSSYTLALLSANRLREVSTDIAGGLLDQLALRCRKVIAYSYHGDAPAPPELYTARFVVTEIRNGNGTEVVILEPKGDSQ